MGIATFDPSKEPSKYQLSILHGLQFKPVYQGTVTRAERILRRKKAKAAKRSRKINRAGK